MLIVGLSIQAAEADTVPLRPVLSAYSLELGYESLTDTYLSPLAYSGRVSALGWERMQAMKCDPEHMVQRLDLRLGLGRTYNPAKTAVMWKVDFAPSYSLLWRCNTGPFTLAAGPQLSGRLGAWYLGANGNNPVAAKASAHLGATGMAVWNGRVWRVPVTLRYQPSIPLVGAFFSPEYDELYYEIWLGNHAGLVHTAWPGNFFRLDSLLTADLHLGTTTLRLGYRCDVLSSKVSGIVSRDVSHMVVLGIATEWLSLRAGARRAPSSPIVSALYR